MFGILVHKVRAFSDWDVEMHRLVVGALVVFRLRLVDMWYREHALLLWVVEGERFLRAHNIAVYVYHDDGAFRQLKDSPPESCFGRVKYLLLWLEGLFRLMPGDVKRNEDTLMVAIKELRDEYNETSEFQSQCRDATICFKGDGNTKA